MIFLLKKCFFNCIRNQTISLLKLKTLQVKLAPSLAAPPPMQSRPFPHLQICICSSVYQFERSSASLFPSFACKFYGFFTRVHIPWSLAMLLFLRFGLPGAFSHVAVCALGMSHFLFNSCVVLRFTVIPLF